MDEIESALKERERRSLVLASAVGIGVCLFYATVSLNLPAGTTGRFFGSLMMVPPIVVLAAGLPLLAKGKGVAAIGYVIVAVLAGMFFAYPHMLYAAMDQARTPPAVIIRSIQVVFGPVLMAFIALTFKPALAIAMAVAVIALHSVNILIVLLDPRTVMTNDTVAGLVGPEVLPQRVYADLAILIMAGIIAVAATIAARHTVREAVTLDRMNGSLRRYFSPDVVDRLVQSGSLPSGAGGTVRDVAVVFTDIAGFTLLASRMSPTDAVALLSAYRERMVREIFDRRGTVDKFIGDGILAVFGTFGASGNAADRALQAALGMERSLAAMNLERVAAGLPPVHHRIGIHFGPAVIGTLVAAGRAEFTAIGDTVNIASRVEQAGKRLGVSLLMSEAVCARLSESRPCLSLGRIELPGVANPMELFTVAPLAGVGAVARTA